MRNDYNELGQRRGSTEHHNGMLGTVSHHALQPTGVIANLLLHVATHPQGISQHTGNSSPQVGVAYFTSLLGTPARSYSCFKVAHLAVQITVVYVLLNELNWHSSSRVVIYV